MENCELAPHDFAITPDYYVFVENRMGMNMAPYLAGLKVRAAERPEFHFAFLARVADERFSVLECLSDF